MKLFDIVTLNQRIIEVEDILFGLTHSNIRDTARNVAATLDMIGEILADQDKFSAMMTSLNDLIKIYQVVFANTGLMNNFIVNTTLQTLKIFYCIIINEENKYLPDLEKTAMVIKNLLVTVHGAKPDQTIATMAEIITQMRLNGFPSFDFFDDEKTTVLAPGKKLKILIVDDEMMHQTLMLKIVEHYGICDIANNGQSALQMFDEAHERHAPYDMITLDIMMPIMDGQQTLKMIRRHERERGIIPDREVTIFMVSSMDGEHVLEAFFRGHCTDYIKKPYSQETIIGKMRSNRLLA